MGGLFKMETNAMKPDKTDELGKALLKGLADADAGRIMPLAEAFRKLRAAWDCRTPSFATLSRWMKRGAAKTAAGIGIRNTR